MTPAALAASQPAALALRRAVWTDRPALEEMFERCSAQTRYRRFHGHVTRFPRRYMDEALAGRQNHFALVARTASGRLVALASCRAEADGVAELGILVEDEYQRLGIGAAALREIAGHARRTGVRVRLW